MGMNLLMLAVATVVRTAHPTWEVVVADDVMGPPAAEMDAAPEIQRRMDALGKAEDGSVAVKMVQEAAPGYYDLILMDIQMPIMDGYEATKQIRALPDKRLAQLPIIAVSANAFEEDKKASLAAGMDGHIAKPINVPDLFALMQKLIK